MIEFHKLVWVMECVSQKAQPWSELLYCGSARLYGRSLRLFPLCHSRKRNCTGACAKSSIRVTMAREQGGSTLLTGSRQNATVPCSGFWQWLMYLLADNMCIILLDAVPMLQKFRTTLLRSSSQWMNKLCMQTVSWTNHILRQWRWSQCVDPKLQ